MDRLAEQLVEKNPDMKVIFMTGYSEEVYSQFKLPEDATVLKPFSLKGALTTVQKLLNSKSKASLRLPFDLDFGGNYRRTTLKKG